MGEVVKLTRKSALEFEKDALRKITLLAEMTLQVPDLLAALQKEPARGAERQAARRFIELMSILENALDMLEDIAPNFTEMPSKWQAIFDVQCAITDFRIRAFATARCSILYVHDFNMDGLDEAFDELGHHRGRLLPPPAA